MHEDKCVYEVFLLLIAYVLKNRLIIVCFIEQTKIYTLNSMVLMGNFKLNCQNIFSSFCYIKCTLVIGRCLIFKSIQYFLSQAIKLVEFIFWKNMEY